MQTESITQRARSRWREILSALGMDSRLLINRHGPCPVCGGKDRFRFDDADGGGSWVCSRDHGTETWKGRVSSSNGFGLLMDFKRCSAAEAAQMIDEVLGTNPSPLPTQKPTKQKTTPAEALALWRQAKRITVGDPVDQYLVRRLGAYNRENCALLRFHPAIARYDGGPTMPGMLAAFTNLHRDITGLQRTYLTDDGRKDPNGISRLTIGELPDGGAVRLGPVSKVMGIAEGVETALAAARLWNMVVWSGLTAGGVLKWQPPEGVEAIVIFGDADENFTGQSAAFQLAHRLMAQKAPGTTNKPMYQVQIELPGWTSPELGVDFNDLLNRGRAA